MATKKINTDLKLEAKLLDASGSAGTNGQILSSTGTVTDWVDLTDIPALGDYLPLAGGTMTGGVTIVDNVGLLFGTGGDSFIKHTGSDMSIYNDVGDINIVNRADDKNIKFYSDDGSGGTAQYFRLEGSEVRTAFVKKTIHYDNVEARFGDSSDLRIYHDGTDSYIDDSGTGDLRIRSNFLKIEKYTGETMATFNDDNSVALYYDNDKKFETTSTGAVITGNLVMGSGQVKFADSGIAFFGDSNDLQIYHDGSNSYITDSSGSGGLRISSNQFRVYNAATDELIINANENSSVELYYDNDKKFETTSTGVTITSTGTGDSLLIANTDDSSDAAPVITLKRDSSTPANGDYLGQLKFKGESDTGVERVYAKITAKTSDVSNEAEDGLIETAVRSNGSNLIVSRQTHEALKLINGTGLEVDGDTTLLGNLTIDGGIVVADPDAAGQVFTWKESDSGTLAGQLRGYANRGDIYLYKDGTKLTELSPSEDSFIPALHIGGTTAASNGVLEVTGDATFSGEVTFKPKHYAATDDLNSDTRTIFSTHSVNNATSNRPINYSSVYTFGGSVGNALQISTNEDYSESGMWIRQYNQNNASPQGTGWQNWTEVWTTNHAALSKITNWDTAYTYSQVGHLENIVEDTSPQLGGNLDMSGRSIYEEGVSSYSIDLKDHGSATWLRNAVGSWVFQTGTAGDSWTNSFTFHLPESGSGYNNKFMELGQRSSNQTDGVYKGVRIVKRSSGSLVDGDFQAGDATFTGNVDIGSNTNGKNLNVYGNATGEGMFWDASESHLTIKHDDGDLGLEIYSVNAIAPTTPQLKIGRTHNQYWGVYTSDRDTHLVHQQDEESGEMRTNFEMWDNNTTDRTGYWRWRSGDVNGGSMYEALLLTQAGDATFTGSATADSFIKDGGTSSQFLKADGSVDSTVYSTTDTTYVSSDFTHDDLTGFVADEHINWKTASQGTIHITNLPATALTSVQIAASQAAQLALTTQEGDVVVRSDENKTYMHNGGTAGTMADFTLLATPTDSVTSVNGATGAVTFGHDDLTGFVANEHIDWTVNQGATNIHSGNYTNTTYTSSDFNHDDLTGFVANEHIDWTTDQGSTNIHVNNITGYLKDTTDTFTGSLAIESGNVTLEEGNKIVFDQDGDTFANIFSDQNNASVLTYNSINGHHFKNGDDGAFDFVKASEFIKDGGTSSQFLKADGSVDSNTYITGSTLSGYVNTSTTQTVGGTKTFSNNLGVGSLSPTSGISSTRILKVSSNGNSEVNVDHTDGGTGSDIGLYSWSRNGDHLAHIKASHEGSTTSSFMSFHTQTSGGSFTNASSNERLRITSGGSIGVNTPSPRSKFDVAGGDNNGISITSQVGSNEWKNLNFRTYVTEAQANAFDDSCYIFTTNPNSNTETAFSKYGGLVIQGRDNGNSSFAIRLGQGSGHSTHMFMGATGVTTFSNTVTAQNFILSSDSRLKENVEDVDNSRVDVDWKTFEMKSNEGQKRYGVIAQELEEKHPEFVRTDDEGMKSVAYVDLLIAKIAELEARLEKLEK